MYIQKQICIKATCSTTTHAREHLHVSYVAHSDTLAAVAKSFTRKDDTNDSANVTEESIQVKY